MQPIVTEKLSDKQSQVIASLTAGATVTEAAKNAEIARQTVYRWGKDPQFVAAYNQFRAETVAAAQEELRGLYGQAVRTMRSILDDEEVSAETRLKAAKTVLDLAKPMDRLGPTDPGSVAECQAALERSRERFKSFEQYLQSSPVSDPDPFAGRSGPDA